MSLPKFAVILGQLPTQSIGKYTTAYPPYVLLFTVQTGFFPSYDSNMRRKTDIHDFSGCHHEDTEINILYYAIYNDKTSFTKN